MGWVVPSITGSEGWSGNTWQAGNAAGAVNTTVPATTKDGDILLAWCCDSGASGTAWTAPAGWTLLASQGASLFRNDLFMKVWRQGDPTSLTFSHLSSSSNAVFILCLRSQVDGGDAAVKIGNPPSSAFAGTFGEILTTGGNILRVPKFSVDTSVDFAVLCWAVSNSSGARASINPYSYQIAQKAMKAGPESGFGSSGGTQNYGMHFAQANDPPGGVAGLQDQTHDLTIVNNTSGTNKTYAMAVVLTDGNGVDGMEADEKADIYLELIDPDVRMVTTDVDAQALSLIGDYGGGAFISE